MKKLLVLLLTILLAGTILVGCSQDSTSNEEGAKTYSLKLGNVLADDDPITLGMRKMAENVKERTNGEVVIDVYPSSQLGDTANVLEQAISGSNVGIIIDTGMLADYVPEMAIYTAPYIFDNVDEARAFIETDVFAGWNEELEGHNLRNLSANWYQGARHFLTNKPVNTPEDLNGVRVRTMGSRVAQESMTALGATPTSLAWSEVYSGLQQGVIDSAEAQLPAVYGSSLHEVVDYISETGHFYLYTGLVISERWFQTLPEEYQQIVIEESIANGDYATELTIEKEEEYKQEMQAAGVEFIQVDTTPFKEATESVYESMGWIELKARIDAELGR
ncbi:TRAP dicarboxylate transporter, DctP subunit [Alkaliphilus metalliredigens QYMF]|uniref:TRAP dicarboxylate transporter, DctP subunit n=1 Tax=Alkaliphilus metalliredigens (strain QYMF) TaxID=293826 RepID=A6TMS5_ALKMQ|nr:C4-dicarboxylate TRAP transporter substrate-binding protein [Alkaliphilus metalliredigens]ABR47493.1 TRAP dicarboxylate transporter, DctP subunit [Alkaliphilus metalliredigens QYMF]